MPGAVSPGIYGLPSLLEESHVVVVPVPFDATTSYGSGTADGPAAVLQASHQVDLFDRETGHPYRRGIAMEPIPRQVQRWNREARCLARPIQDRDGDLGRGRVLREGLARVNELGAKVNEWARGRTAAHLGAGKLPFVLGGDHACAFGSIQACADAHPGLGILHLDAHADLRVAYQGFTWSHASIMYNVVSKLRSVKRLVQVGLRDLCAEEEERIRRSQGRIRAHFDADIAAHLAEGKPFATLARRIVRALPRDVYVSLDIDGLDPSLSPGTGTPVPGGLSWHQTTFLLGTLARSGRRIVGGDLCEVAPGPVGEWDANVGARLLYKLIGFALISGAGGGRKRAKGS